MLLRTGSVVRRGTVWVSPSPSSKVGVVSATWTVTICPACIRPKLTRCRQTRITPVLAVRHWLERLGIHLEEALRLTEHEKAHLQLPLMRLASAAELILQRAPRPMWTYDTSARRCWPASTRRTAGIQLFVRFRASRPAGRAHRGSFPGRASPRDCTASVRVRQATPKAYSAELDR